MDKTSLPKKRIPIIALILSFIVFLIAFFTISLLIKSNLGIKTYRTASMSMQPTLVKGDLFIVNRKYYQNNKPTRKDVVLFPFPLDPNKDFIMRVIGLSGDKIEIQNNQVFINDLPFEENYVFSDDNVDIESIPNVQKNFGPIMVPEQKLFVLGDNRNHSFDSRFWGFLDISDLKGKATYIYWSKGWKRIGKQIQ